MKDREKLRAQVLNGVLEVTARRLEEFEKGIEEVHSLTYWSRNPRERTMINIILDDQKKVARALERLMSDLEETMNEGK